MSIYCSCTQKGQPIKNVHFLRFVFCCSTFKVMTRSLRHYMSTLIYRTLDWYGMESQTVPPSTTASSAPSTHIKVVETSSMNPPKAFLLAALNMFDLKTVQKILQTHSTSWYEEVGLCLVKVYWRSWLKTLCSEYGFVFRRGKKRGGLWRVTKRNSCIGENKINCVHEQSFDYQTWLGNCVFTGSTNNTAAENITITMEQINGWRIFWQVL